jgi:Na+/melibiose symporter-like transporter
MKQSEEAVKSLKKIPFKIKVGYGVTGWATLFTFTVFTTYGLYFFTDVAGLAPAFAGLLLAIGTLWDAVTDPLIGAWTDKRDPAKGRRRPFIFAVALPFGIVSWLMFTNWGFEDLGTKVYFMLIVIAYYSVQTLLDIPYTALGAEMTKDYDERSSLNSHRAFWATVGSILTGFTLILVSYFTELTENEYLGWSITNAVFGFLSPYPFSLAGERLKVMNFMLNPKKSFPLKTWLMVH